MEVRAHEIYTFIANNPNCTEGEIARGVGLKRTPYTRMILQSLMYHGHITRHWQEDRKPKPGFIYYCQATVPMDLQ